MKKYLITSIIALLTTGLSTVSAQEWPEEYLGLPGDNLNLYSVMKLFQESETLESFERKLNDENSGINNLDLNSDNLVDYIMVIDYVDGDVHNIVLRVALNRYENQDVAVFTVQRFNNGSVQIQLIGDEELYGKNYIVEPNYDDNFGETPNPGYTGRSGFSGNVTVIRTNTFEVAAWPLIRFIYLPTYIAWHSLWHWGYYPSFWNPWRPWSWHYYYGYHYHWYPHYYSYYRHWRHCRYARYNDFYYRGIRSHSSFVSSRIHQGSYRSTYSHPEQRRHGEALYARMHSSGNSGSRNNASVYSRDRRSSSPSVRTQVNSGNRYEDRRSSGSGSNRYGNTGNSHRSVSSVSGRRSSGNLSGQNSGIKRNQSSAITGRKSSGTSVRRDAPSRPSSVSPNRTESGSSYGKSGSGRSSVSAAGRIPSRSSVNQVPSGSRRSVPAVSNSASSRSTNNRIIASSKKSMSSVNSRSGSTSTSQRSSAFKERSSPSVSQKSASRPSYSQPVNQSRRSPSVSSSRSVSRSSSVQKSSKNSNSDFSSRGSGNSGSSERNRSSRR